MQAEQFLLAVVVVAAAGWWSAGAASEERRRKFGKTGYCTRDMKNEDGEATTLKATASNLFM